MKHSILVASGLFAGLAASASAQQSRVDISVGPPAVSAGEVSARISRNDPIGGNVRIEPSLNVTVTFAVEGQAPFNTQTLALAPGARAQAKATLPPGVSGVMVVRAEAVGAQELSAADNTRKSSPYTIAAAPPTRNVRTTPQLPPTRQSPFGSGGGTTPAGAPGTPAPTPSPAPAPAPSPTPAPTPVAGPPFQLQTAVMKLVGGALPATPPPPFSPVAVTTQPMVLRGSGGPPEPLQPFSPVVITTPPMILRGN